MIRSFRATGRIILVAVFLVSWSVRMRLRRPPEGSAAYEDWRRIYFSGAARGILDRLHVRVSVTGEFPQEAGILVSNHLSYLDVMVLASVGPTVFVSRADVEHWPVIGPLTRWCSTIYIDRQRRDQIPEVIERMAGALATGAQVVFFPEGTSGSGETVMPFRAALFDVATASQTPVHAAVLGYQTRPGDPVARDSVCWWGDAGFASHLFTLAGLTDVQARVQFLPGKFRGTDRKELATQCHRAVVARFRPVTGSEDRA